MAAYTYKIKDRNGQIITGAMEADSEASVINNLQKKGCFPISVTEQKKKGGRLSNEVSIQIFQRIRIKDIAVFTMQLSNLINSGMPLVKALSVLVRQTENKKLKAVTESLRNDVQGGSSFSDAIAKYPLIFSRLYVSMIKAGELGGILEIVLASLSEFLEEDQALKSKIKAALVYPAVMSLVGVATVLFLMAFVIPRFVMMFQDIGRTLPLPTQILIFGSRFLRTYWWIYLPMSFLLVFVFRRYIRKDEGKAALDRIKLKMPVFGKIIRKVAIARFARTLGTLIQNGVSILNALKMTREIVANRMFAEEINKIHTELKDGGNLTQLLTKCKEFPPIVADMVAIGEETGKIDDSLLKVAGSYEREIENELKGLTSLLEPAVILFMGIIVGFIVLAMLLPVFEITSVIQ
ncbi:MAG: type II secretion system F family protein [Candidatus Aureabacteria bacterium]|nr:type II secretion system F family protein [Candidatus Auribacterota bacterium]